MTCSQDSFLLEIPRRHISKCFPLVFSLAKPLQLPTRASGWSVTASPQRPEQWEEEPLVLSPHPLQKKGPGGSHQMSDICKELLLILQLGSCNSLHGWTTALMSRYSKTQHRSWKFSYGQKKLRGLVAVGFGWRCWGGASTKLPPFGASDRAWLLPQCWLQP